MQARDSRYTAAKCIPTDKNVTHTVVQEEILLVYRGSSSPTFAFRYQPTSESCTHDSGSGSGYAPTAATPH
jgi:hypothetical protein